jgi:hypothetical protein
VPAPAEPAAAPVVVADQPVRKSHALGIFALILGLIAFLGDIGVLVFAVIQIAAFAQTLDFSTGLTGLAAFAGLALLAFWVGIAVAALAVLLGLIAAIKNRGRAAGIVGLIFGLLVLITHISIGLSILGAGAGISNLGS